eukprot:TRINITY_DN254_c0_g1_i4.p1 TRINITY_DN254_c0_g1~~TRINITY_DN254_c0_g1_i4.p1  ORF type:complete len:392 (-),score=53.20 TRINITY_DN254_c0_g1_i4:364-1539(-)
MDLSPYLYFRPPTTSKESSSTSSNANPLASSYFQPAESRFGSESSDDSFFDSSEEIDGGRTQIVFSTASSMNASPEPSELHSRLSNYYQSSTLGYGTYGCVYKVLNTLDHQYYACKVLHRDTVVKKRQLAHIRNEKKILQSLDSPFIIQLHSSFVDELNVYFILEFVNGYEFFYLLRTAERYSRPHAAFYAGEVILALGYLHERNIAYRDLKPENVLVSLKGHVKLCDFGFAKTVEDRTWTMCGTPEYIAPEIVLGLGHNKSADWWSLGVFVYEMIACHPPFYGNTSFVIYDKICEGKYHIPKAFDAETKSFVKQLIVQQRSRRLGNTHGGVQAIKDHPFFSGMDWKALANREVTPPPFPRGVRTLCFSLLAISSHSFIVVTCTNATLYLL